MLRVVRPEAAPRLLTTLEVKAELISALGVEELVVIPFVDGFAEQTAQAAQSGRPWAGGWARRRRAVRTLPR